MNAQITDIIQIFNSNFIVASEPYYNPTKGVMMMDLVKMDTGEKWEVAVHVIQNEGSVLSAS